MRRCLKALEYSAKLTFNVMLAYKSVRTIIANFFTENH